MAISTGQYSLTELLLWAGADMSAADKVIGSIQFSLYPFMHILKCRIILLLLKLLLTIPKVSFLSIKAPGSCPRGYLEAIREDKEGLLARPNQEVKFYSL